MRVYLVVSVPRREIASFKDFDHARDFARHCSPSARVEERHANYPRISNEREFNAAIEAYLEAGLTDPSAICLKLNERGAICYAVGVELYLQKRELKKSILNPI